MAWLPNIPATEASTVCAVRSIRNFSRWRSRRRPSRSMVSENTVGGSRPETKLLEQTLCATTPVATRRARSGRQLTQAAVSTTSTTASAIHFSQRKILSRSPSQRPISLARRLRRTNRGQRLHGDARRRHVVIRHEEIGHQRYGLIDPITFEI